MLIVTGLLVNGNLLIGNSRFRHLSGEFEIMKMVLSYSALYCPVMFLPLSAGGTVFEKKEYLFAKTIVACSIVIDKNFNTCNTRPRNRMNTTQLAKRMTGMDTNSKEYKELAVLYAKALEIENTAHAYRQKLVRGLLTLVEPARLINRSKLVYLSNKQIIALGKAARLLNTEIRKAGIMPDGEGKEREWREF